MFKSIKSLYTYIFFFFLFFTIFLVPLNASASQTVHPTSGKQLAVCLAIPQCMQCNDGVQCGGCYAYEPYNTCGYQNFYQTCTYTTYDVNGPPGIPGCIQNSYSAYCGTWFYNNCAGGYWCSGGQCITWCSWGAINCGTCNGNRPANTCGTNVGGTQTCTHDGPQPCAYSTFTNNCQFSYNNCSNNYTCVNGNTCETTINAHAYIDYNNDGKQDNGEPNLAGVTLNDNGYIAYTDNNGNATDKNTALRSGVKAYVQMSVPNPYNGQYYTNPVQVQSITLNNNNGGSWLYYGFVPAYSISGEIYHDTDENGYLDNGEGGIQSGTLTINGTSVPINADGTYSATNLPPGNYTVAYTPAPGWQTIYPATSFNVTVGTPGQNPACNPGGYRGDGCDPWGNIVTLNIGINQLHTISGRIYDDVNKDDFYTIGVDNGLGKGTLTLTGPTNEKATINADGTYSAANLLSGTYTVTYAPPDISWQAIYPPNLTTTVTVGNKGAACNPGNNHDSDNANGGGQTYTVCTATYDITGLNFGVSNEFAWVQGICTDMRSDAGFSDPVPTTANCGGTSAPYASIVNAAICPGGTVGIIYTGNTDANFSLGGSSSTGWVVGGNPTTSYPETFTPVNKTVIRSSYAYVTATLQQAGITPTDLSTVCSLSNCSLPVALPSGVYLANGDLYIATQSAYGNSNLAYQAQPNTNVTILVNGTTYIDGKITIPQGNASAFTLISAGNITVDAGVGETNVTSLASDLDGFYSTDQSFILNSAGSCNPDGTPQDKKFNAAGAIIVNAGETGGSFQNNRDLCVSDPSCPVVTLSQRIDLLLNASSVTKHVNNFFQEVAP